MKGEGKYLLINLFILLSSIAFILIVIFAWGVLDYLLLSVFLLSSMLTFICFHLLKLTLLKRVLKTGLSEEYSEDQRRMSLTLFLLILLFILLPIICVFVVPRFGLFVINGVVCGASISNLVFYFKDEEKKWSNLAE